MIYKAYSDKYGWSRDYNKKDDRLLFKFNDEYIRVKSTNLCIGIELLDDTDSRWSKQITRDKKISNILNEDYGQLYTNHLYQYPGKLKVGQHVLDNPYLFIIYQKGVFYFEYSYNDNIYKIPLSYINEHTNNYINLDILIYVGNKFEDIKEVNNKFYGKIR